MISHSHKFIWIPINKTATTSMQHLLEKQCKLIEPKHETLLEAKKRTTPDQFRYYFKFSVVRNPWERAVSLYTYRKKKHRIPYGLSFKDWVENTFYKNKLYPYDQKNKKFVSPQLFWLRGLDAKVRLNFIGRMESLDEGWHKICKHIGIEYSPLPIIKKTKHKHYTEYYDDRTLKIVSRRFKRDIIHFKYKYGE